MTLTNMTRIDQLLEDPASDSSLDQLKAEMNELAKLRQGSRVAFCKRIALVYMIIVGQRPAQGKPLPKRKDFNKWCSDNLRSGTGKKYTTGTISSYLTVGFASNPEKKIVDEARRTKRRDERMRKLGNGLSRAIDNGTKVIPITKLRDRNLSNDVAQQVNALMRTWEQAAPIARSQFIYMVTGARIAATG